MGRKHGRGYAPQRSRLVANRELREALNAERPKAIGAKRCLDYSSTQAILSPIKEIIDDNSWPDGVRARWSLQVTLLHRKSVEKRLDCGLVFGYRVGKALAEVERDLPDAAPQHITCELGKAALFQNRHFGFHVISDELELERKIILDVMADLGLKGVHRDVPRLHVTVADVGFGIAKDERDETLDVLNAAVPTNLEVVLNPLHFYSEARHHVA